MILAHLKRTTLRSFLGLGWICGLTLALTCGVSWAQDANDPSTNAPAAAAAQAPIVEPNSEPLPKQAEKQKDLDIDWRDALLTEPNTLANTLDAQQKFESILRDKLDILSHRIDQLEQSNQEQKERITELLSAQSKPSKTSSQVSLPQAPLPQANELDAPIIDATPPEPLSEKAAPLSEPPAAQTPKQGDKEQDPVDFEQFLEMGEAMMRRFFGVVQEFRKEFDDNRA